MTRNIFIFPIRCDSGSLYTGVACSIKVTPQEEKLPKNVFESFHECSLPRTVLKNTVKEIGHRAHLRDMVGQSYPIFMYA